MRALFSGFAMKWLYLFVRESARRLRCVDFGRAQWTLAGPSPPTYAHQAAHRCLRARSAREPACARRDQTIKRVAHECKEEGAARLGSRGRGRHDRRHPRLEWVLSPPLHVPPPARALLGRLQMWLHSAYVLVTHLLGHWSVARDGKHVARAAAPLAAGASSRTKKRVMVSVPASPMGHHAKGRVPSAPVKKCPPP